MSFSSAMAVSSGTMPSAAPLLSGPVEIFTIPGVPVGDQAVDHRLVLPEQRAAGSHAGEDLVDVLRLHLARNLAHHRRLVLDRLPPARRRAHYRSASRSRAYRPPRWRRPDSFFGEHADQDVTFRRVVNFTGVVFAARQDVQAHAVTVKFGVSFMLVSPYSELLRCGERPPPAAARLRCGHRLR